MKKNIVHTKSDIDFDLTESLFQSIESNMFVVLLSRENRIYRVTGD